MNRIKVLRLEKGLTQAELGQTVGVIQTAIGKYERGELEPNISLLTKLADYFGCSIDYLVGRSDDYGNVTTVGDGYSFDEKSLVTAFRRIKSERRALILDTVVALAEYDAKT